MEDAGIVAEFVKYGIFGALFFLSLLALRSRDASYREVQDKRIAEGQGNFERSLQATTANTQATQAAAEGFKALAQALDRNTTEVTKLSEKVSALKVSRR